MATTTMPATLVIVTRDGADVSPIFPTDVDAVAWMHRRHSFSVDHAVNWEGYGFRRATHTATGAPITPWTDGERRQHAASARNAMRHDHPRIGTPEWDEWTGGTDDGADLVRYNCAACRLRGYADGFTENGDGTRGALAPNHCSWERIYVESGTPVPQRYRAALVEALNGEDAYAVALARSVATFGIRFTD